jgi:hypothetical protein
MRRCEFLGKSSVRKCLRTAVYPSTALLNMIDGETNAFSTRTRDQWMRGLLSLFSGEKSQTGCALSSDAWSLGLPLVRFSKLDADVWTPPLRGRLIMN